MGAPPGLLPPKALRGLFLCAQRTLLVGRVPAESRAGVALHAKPSVAAQCDLRVNHGDLTALLFLQGYSREEFVET